MLQPPTLSLVIPVRDERGSLTPLVGEIAAALDAAGEQWELRIVDDGSTDGSWQEIESLAAADPRIHATRFERGRGKSAALAAGFAACRGERIVMLDGDGQDVPGEIPRLLAALDRGADLANGWKTPRLDPWHKTIPSRVFNALVGWLTGLRLHDHNCGLKAFRREVADALELDEGMHRFIPVLAAANGFRVCEVPVRHRSRVRGQTKYGPGRFFSGLRDLLRVVRRHRIAPADETASREKLRGSTATLLALVACGMLAGRIGSVASIDRAALEKRIVADTVARRLAAGRPADPQTVREEIRRDKRLLRPFLSANDRSRWLTIRALVERGSFAIEDLVVEPGWDTIDAVVHNDAQGTPHLYSSKPPLLPLLLAGPYWLANRLTGWTLADHPFELGRGLMLLYGLLPLAITIVFTSKLVERIGTTDFGRIYAVALICFGTFLGSFAVVLTNHLPAAACVAVSGWGCWRIGIDGARSSGLFVVTGLTAALAAAFDLPALAWTAAVIGLSGLAAFRQTLTLMVPAVILVAAASLAANHAAHGTFEPAYAHRRGEENWYDYEFTLPDGRRITSYWRDPHGIDRGEPSLSRYAVHAVVGHHGILSLTPAWLLVPAGIGILAGGDRRRRAAAIAIGAMSLVVIGFYLTRDAGDRNYGGMTSCFRWVLWLAPLWVAAVVPMADRLAGSRGGRLVAGLLLAASCMSAAYPTWNPWVHPWIFDWMAHAGWIRP